MEWEKSDEKKPSTLLEILLQLKKALELERDKHQNKIGELQQLANTVARKNPRG